ncbi:hypothetical protein ACFL1P_01635 [Patescibacteria group bacterium]
MENDRNTPWDKALGDIMNTDSEQEGLSVKSEDQGSNCVKKCIVIFCAVRDEPKSEESEKGCPLHVDDDGVPLCIPI